jgi:hypothetical protein
MKFGLTFSEPYAESLGLARQEVFRALLRDLGLRVIRICAYWNRIEPRPDDFHFDSLERQIEEAASAGLEIIVTVGQKAPRWPEYHFPPWTDLRSPDLKGQLFRMLGATVTHFRAFPISVWQVENEPFVSFGGPRIPEDLLRRELELVRSLDDRPVMLTDSADKGKWTRAARWCDVLGVNLYTRVWNGRRYVDIDLSASDYRKKINEVALAGTPVIASELQSEPWGPRAVTELPPAEAAMTMNPERLRANVQLAADAGFDTVLFWGGEWWYWLRESGDDTMFETAGQLVERFA